MTKKSTIEPKQKRSVATRKKIKETAKKLFSEEGYYAVTTNAIAAKANLPIGSFYNYFKNKKILLLELIDDFTELYHSDTVDQFDDTVLLITSKKTAIEIMEVFIRMSISSPALNDPFYKVLHSLQFTDPDILAFSEEVRLTEINIIVKFLEAIHQFHPQKNIPLKAKLLHTTMENVVLYNNILGTTFKEEELIAETIELLYKYLFGEENLSKD